MCDWFTEARFGMFIHFGLYSIPAGIWQGEIMPGSWYAEWIQTRSAVSLNAYRKLATRFNPDAFNAESWVEEAALAGMKYLLITAKHHDGFALWPSKVSAYNIVDATSFQRDILRELESACLARGLKFGVYYSHWLDWEYPGGGMPLWPTQAQPEDRAFEAYWQNKCLPQVAELLHNYQISYLWFDNWAPTPLLTPKRIDELIDLVRRINPECLVNSRIGSTWNHPDADVDITSMPDNQFPETRLNDKWETSATLNRSWGYHQLDYAWKSSRELLECLINNVSRNGNFQLNVGPLSNGKFPVPAIRRLREIGAWLNSHGEAIYRTQPVETPEPDWGRLTERRDLQRVYAVILKSERKINLHKFRNFSRASMLETGQEVPICQSGENILLTLPDECSPADINVIVLQYQRSEPL